MEHFSYKSWCGVYESTCIDVLKKELALAIDKWLQFTRNKMLFKTAIPLRN